MLSKRKRRQPDSALSSSARFVLPLSDQTRQALRRIKITKPAKRICASCGREVRDTEGMFKKGIHRDRVCLQCHEVKE